MSKAAQGSCEPFPHALPASPLQGARPTFPSRDGSFFTMAQSRGATDSAKVYSRSNAAVGFASNTEIRHAHVIASEIVANMPISTR